MVANSSKPFSFAFVISVIVMMLMYMVPQIKVIVPYDRLALVSFIFVALFVLRTDSNHIIRVLLCALPYSFLMFIVARQGDFKYGFVHPLMTLWLLVFPAILATEVVGRNNQKEMMVIVVSSLIVLVVSLFLGISVFGENQDALRALAARQDEDYVQDLTQRGVGGFGATYSTGGLLVACLLSLRFSLKKVTKILLVVLSLFLVYYILNAQFATLIIITFLSAAYYFYSTAKSSRQKFLIFAIGCLFVIAMPSFMQLIVNFFGDTTVGDKFSQMDIALFEGGGGFSNVSGQRSKFQLDALRLFLQSPIWGNSMSTGNNAVIEYSSHSTLLSVMACTGLIGLSSYYFTFSSSVRILLKKAYINQDFYNPIIFYLILFSVFNPITGSLEAMWCYFVIIPLLYKLFIAGNGMQQS